MKRLTLILMLLTANAVAQTGVVTGSVTDSDGQAWTNGTWGYEFFPNPSYPSPSSYTINGVPLTNYYTAPVTGTLDSSGNLVATGVPRSDQISPIGSQWKFKICPKASSACGTFQVATSLTTNVTSAITSAISAPRFQAVHGTYGYNDTETTSPQPTGATYWNVVQLCQRYFNGSSWNCGGGGNDSGVDIRPISVQTTGKTGTLTAGGTTQVFNASGGGTITNIHMTVGTQSSLDARNLVENSTIQIACDGDIQNVPWGLFFLSQDAPVSFLTNTISVAEQTASFSSGQMSYNRRTEINYTSGCTISLINASATATANIYTDISYKIGNSATTRAHWNSYVTNLPIDLFPSTTLGSGELESITQYLLSASDYTYLEVSPIVTADGVTAVVSNGGEDFNGAGFYYNFGANSLHTDKWGWSIGLSGLQTRMAPYDSLAYRFFGTVLNENVYFSTSLGISWTWLSSGSIPTGKGLVTYWTALPIALQPTASPAAGQYSSTQSVTLTSATSGAVICYVTDGSAFAAHVPGVCPIGSTTYSSPISATVGTTIKSMATKVGYTDSFPAIAAYTAIQTFTFVGHNEAQCGTPSTTCSTAAFTPVTGHVVILCGSQTSGSGIMTLSGIGANVVTSIGPVSQGINCWVILSTLNVSITPTITVGSSVSYTQVFYAEFSSTLPAVIDTNAFSSYDSSLEGGATATNFITNYFTTSGNNRLLISYFQDQGGGQPTSLSGGSPNAWVMSGTVGPNYFTMFYQLNANKVTNKQYTLTGAASNWWATQLFALK